MYLLSKIAKSVTLIHRRDSLRAEQILQDRLFADEKINEFASEHSTSFIVALAEGVSSWQVYKALSEIKFLSGKLENIPDEGTIAPASYDFVIGMTKETLIKTILGSQNQYSINITKAKKIIFVPNKIINFVI